MKFNFVLVLIIFRFFTLSSQVANIKLENYYKNETLRYSNSNLFTSFFPINESQIAITDSIKDKTVFYYDLPVWFFQKHWIEINKNKFYIHFSPFVNFSYGKSTDISDIKPLYRNARGIYSEGEIGKKFSFQFLLSENQSSFCDYEAQYFKNRGEIYTTENGYNIVNAIIPSGARTKEFKKTIYPNAFDYAFSMGSISFQINKKNRVEFGNNQHFIGLGYRSIFITDNTIVSPYIRFISSIGKKFEYQLLTKKHLNLVRKPYSYGLEDPYENKWFLAHYLSFKATKSFTLSLFSGGNHLRGDSLVKHNVNPTFLIPTFNTDLWSNSKIINGINGVNLDYYFKKVKLYSQLAVDVYKKQTLLAFQFGLYYFDILKIKKFDIQVEYNYVPNNFYSSSNFKLAYSNGNLPFAHPKGNNFSEVFLNLSYSLKRFQFVCTQFLYFSKVGDIYTQINQNSIFYDNEWKKYFYNKNGITYLFIGELIYRFNNKYNAQLYFQFKSRIVDMQIKNIQINIIQFGLRTSLFNQYLDF